MLQLLDAPELDVSGLGWVRDKQEPRCLRVGKMRQRRHPALSPSPSLTRMRLGEH